jgi:hypothetical protein
MTFRRSAVIAIVVVGGYAAYRHFATPLTLASAIAAGKITTQSSFGGGEAPSTITTMRAAGTLGQLTIVIPAGTLLYTQDAFAQRLITAGAVTIVIPNGVAGMNVEMKTFCVDEFATIPLAETPLSFTRPPEENFTRTEEVEPLHKLADCMSGSTLSDADKQLAVWAVSSDLLHRSPVEALEFLTSHFQASITRDQDEKIVRDKRPALIRDHPSLSELDIDTLIRNEMESETAEIYEKAAREATAQLRNFLEHDRELLASCGYDVGDLSIFR